MMEFMIVTNKGTETLTAKEAGKRIREMKASGFKLDPTFSRYHYRIANSEIRRASSWGYRYVTHCYFRHTGQFECEAINIVFSTADWFRDRH